MKISINIILLLFLIVVTISSCKESVLDKQFSLDTLNQDLEILKKELTYEQYQDLHRAINLKQFVEKSDNTEFTATYRELIEAIKSHDDYREQTFIERDDKYEYASDPVDCNIIDGVVHDNGMVGIRISEWHINQCINQNTNQVSYYQVFSTQSIKKLHGFDSPGGLSTSNTLVVEEDRMIIHIKSRDDRFDLVNASLPYNGFVKVLAESELGIKRVLDIYVDERGINDAYLSLLKFLAYAEPQAVTIDFGYDSDKDLLMKIQTKGLNDKYYQAFNKKIQ